MAPLAVPWQQTAVAHDASRVDLLSLDQAALGELVEREGERAFRARQMFAWLHQRGARTTAEMTDLPAAFRARLAAIAELRALAVDEVKVAADGTRKYRLRTHDGCYVESVYIPNASGPGKNALCISSQVGCAMGCAFCATAALSLVRHLSPGEIVGQLYAVVRDLEERAEREVAHAAALPRGSLGLIEPGAGISAEPKEHRRRVAIATCRGRDAGIAGKTKPGDESTQVIHAVVADDAEADLERDVQDPTTGMAPRQVQNLVYMGMGEPLHNVDNVISSIRLLTAPAGQGMSPRRITVSTSGLVPGIARLGAETDVHLAVSLNATTDEVRARLMPVDRRWPIAALMGALDAFPLAPRRRVTLEYVLLAGNNDSDDDARRLAELVHGRRVKVNLIPFNAHPLSPFARPAPERVEAFRAILDRAHVSCFVRSTRGADIDAACGMLGGDRLAAARGPLGPTNG